MNMIFRRRQRFGRVAAAIMLGLSPVALGIAMSQPAAAQRHVDRDALPDEFHDALDQHGDWVRHPRYGDTWVPFANEDRAWRPYSRGQWVFTEEHGWYWESDEEFGWVTYHYGRWVIDQRHGWMWVPGTEWGPAWVAWRQSEDTVGWAPLPPEAEMHFDGDGVATFDSLESPRYAPMWIFVAPAMLTLPSIWRHFHPPHRSMVYLGRTRPVTHYTWRDRRIYNRGIDRGFVERHARRPVPIVQTRPLPSPRDVGRRPPGGGGREIGIYRPQLPPGGNRSPGFDDRRRPGLERPPIARPQPDSRPPPSDGRQPFPRGPRDDGPVARPQMPPGGSRTPGFDEPRRQRGDDGPPIGRQQPPESRPPFRRPPREDAPIARPQPPPSEGRQPFPRGPRDDGVGSRPSPPPQASPPPSQRGEPIRPQPMQPPPVVRNEPPRAAPPPPPQARPAPPPPQSPPPQAQQPRQRPAERPPQGPPPQGGRPQG